MSTQLKERLIYKIITNKLSWAILAVSLLLNFFITGDKWVEEGIKLIPQTIGVLWGGLVATVTIIFTLIKEEDLIRLKRQSPHFTNALLNLKNHLSALLISLLLSILSFYIEIPIVTTIMDKLNIPILNMFYFLESFFLLFSVYSAYEVINSLFLVFEIKLSLLDTD